MVDRGGGGGGGGGGVPWRRPRRSRLESGVCFALLSLLSNFMLSARSYDRGGNRLLLCARAVN